MDVISVVVFADVIMLNVTCLKLDINSLLTEY